MDNEVERLLAVWEWVIEGRKQLISDVDKCERNLTNHKNSSDRRLYELQLTHYQECLTQFDTELKNYTKRSNPPFELFKNYTGNEPTLSWIGFYLEGVKRTGIPLLALPGYTGHKYYNLAIAAYSLTKIFEECRRQNIDPNTILDSLDSQSSRSPFAYLEHYFQTVTRTIISSFNKPPSKVEYSEANFEEKFFRQIADVLNSGDVKQAVTLRKAIKYGGPYFVGVVALSLLTGIGERTIERAIENVGEFTF